jgi:hypothetical protein
MTSGCCKWSPLPGVSLKRTAAVSKIYPKNQKLFVDYLELGSIDGDDIIDDIRDLDARIDEIPRIKALLKALSRFIKRKPDDVSLVDDLGGEEKIWPVVDTTLHLRAFADKWFIADRERLQTCFQGKVPLLDFGRHDVQRLEPLLSKLELDEWMISQHVEEETQTVGVPVYQEILTAHLRSKARFISR